MKIVDICDTNSSLLQMKLLDMRCKHVLSLDWKEKLVLRYSEECGYEWCLWGTHGGHAKDTNYHKNRIYQMQVDDFKRPIRIVICSYPFSRKKYIWADNLHTCIHYIRQYGLDVKLKDVPFYIVDISNYEDIVGSYKGSVINNATDIAKAIECAYSRRIWSNNRKLLETNYLVADFLKNNRELYTYKNVNLGLIAELDLSGEKIDKSQAFNYLWTEE